MVGRLLGPSGKLLVGATMVVVAAVDACYSETALVPSPVTRPSEAVCAT